MSIRIGLPSTVWPIKTECAIDSGTHLDGSTMPQHVDPISVPQLPRTRQGTKSCPFCAEMIRSGAIKCRFCGEFLSGDPRQAEGGRQQTNSGGPGTASPAPGPQPGASRQSSPDNENGSEILWFGRPSLLALMGTFLKTACFVALCWAVYRYPVTIVATYIPKVNVSTELLVQIEGWLDLGALGLSLAALWALLWRAISLKSIYYEVTPDRIEWSRGIFDRHIDNLDMFRVIDLKLRRSLIECLLGIGTVVLATNDESDPTFEFFKVHQCRYLYDIIKEAGLKADKKRGVIHLE